MNTKVAIWMLGVVAFAGYVTAAEAQPAPSQSLEAEARYRLNKEIETDRQRTAFYNGLQELESELNKRGYPIGTKEHAEAYAAYASVFPLARSLPDVDQVLKLHAAVHDDQAALERRIKTDKAAVEAQGQAVEGITVTEAGDINLRTRANTPETRLERYGYTKEQFLNPFKVERGTIDNGKFKGSDTGNVVKITAGSDTQGNPVVRTMSVPEFNEFKAAFTPKEVTDKALLPIVPDK